MISTIITFIVSVSLFITGGHLISTNLKLHHYKDNDYKEIIMLKNMMVSSLIGIFRN